MKQHHIVILAGAIGLGVVAGWITRSSATQSKSFATDADTSTGSSSPSSRRQQSEGAAAGNVYLDVYGTASLQDPNSPDYDVMHLMSATTTPPNMAFDAEPVNKSWAPVQEAAIRYHLEKDILALSPNINITDIECRTATCKAAFEAPSQDESDDLTGSYPAAVMSDGTFIGGCKDGLDGPSHDKGMVRTCFYLTYSEEHRDPDEYARWYKRHKKALFERLVDGPWCEDKRELCEALAADDHGDPGDEER